MQSGNSNKSLQQNVQTDYECVRVCHNLNMWKVKKCH